MLLNWIAFYFFYFFLDIAFFTHMFKQRTYIHKKKLIIYMNKEAHLGSITNYTHTHVCMSYNFIFNQFILNLVLHSH